MNLFQKISQAAVLLGTLFASARGGAAPALDASCVLEPASVTKTTIDLHVPNVKTSKLDAKSDCKAKASGDDRLGLDATCVAKKILASDKPATFRVVFDAVPAALAKCVDASDPKATTVAVKVGNERAAVNSHGQLTSEAGNAQWVWYFDGASLVELTPKTAARRDALNAATSVLVASKQALAVFGAQKAANNAAPADPCSIIVPRYDSAQKDFVLPGLDGVEFDACKTTQVQGKTHLDGECFGKLLSQGQGAAKLTSKPLAADAAAAFAECKAKDSNVITITATVLPPQNVVPAIKGNADATATWPQVWADKQFVPVKGQDLTRYVLALNKDGSSLAFIKLNDGPPPPTNCPERDPKQPVVAWCPAAVDSDIMCVDLACGDADVLVSPPRQVMQPNRGLVVRVRHRSGAKTTVTWGGDRGLVQLQTDGGEKAESHGLALDKAAEKEPAPQVTSFGFSPRKPGQADVHITVTGPGSTESTTRDIELEIEPLSWGAARFGFAALFGNVVARTYTAEQVAGSKQLEIREKGSNHFGWEATVGLAPYVLDLVTCPGHGRSHVGGCNRRVAPYFGIGIVGQAADGVSAFNSFYLGAEFEFASNFSVAAAAVWRNVDTLRHGYVEGSAVESGTDFTRSSTQLGFGVVLNVSPDFLQFAMGGSGKTGTSGGTAANSQSAPATTGKTGDTDTTNAAPGTQTGTGSTTETTELVGNPSTGATTETTTTTGTGATVGSGVTNDPNSPDGPPPATTGVTDGGAK